jgi:hypothetical protein
MQDKEQADQANTGKPFFCARYQDFDLCFEGMGWDLPRTNAMMDGLENTRYADICGDDIAAMDGLGWEFIAEPVCFTATDRSGKVVACAWAAPMRAEDGAVGCNLSYAVDAHYEGRSLARLLSCLAFLGCDRVHGGMGYVNIESRADNHASIALARAMAFERYPDGDFTMPLAGGAGEAAFYCLRAGVGALRQRALEILREKNLPELLSLIRGSGAASAS